MRKSKQYEADRELHERSAGNQSLLAETEKPEVVCESEKPKLVCKSEKPEERFQCLRYTLTEIPPLPVCFFMAIQHVLVNLVSAMAMTSIVSDCVCAGPGHSVRSRLFGTSIFMQGICTIIQTLLGIRLPVYQGPSGSFLVPLFALAHMPGWSCQGNSAATDIHYGNGTDTLASNQTYSSAPASLTLEEKLQQLSGSLMVASLLEVAVGGLGLIRHMLRYIGPLTVGPTIALIGLSLFKLPVMYAKFNPLITLGSAVLVVVFSLYLSRIQIPLPRCRKGGDRSYLPIFQLLPVLMAMVVMWFLSFTLTVTDVMPDDKSHPFYYSRTDATLSVITEARWIQLTYPGQFGPPSINFAAAIGFLAAVLASLVESIGDYYAAARCCNVMPPPDHAISRGILMEGLGSVLSGAVGAAHATTSYSSNIAMLNLTKTASRSVLVVAGLLLIALSLFGKIGAAFAIMPAPILGGILLAVLGLMAALGMSTLQYADMTSDRNLLVIGMAFLTGFSVPAFVETHPDMVTTGNEHADQVIRVVLGTPMFLGGLVALILDNTAPGSDLERGIIGWKISHSGKPDITTTSSKTESPSSPLLTTSVDDAAADLHQPADNNINSTDRINSSKQGEARIKGSQRKQPGDEAPNAKEAQRELTEDDVYAFASLKGRLSSPLWRFVPFLPPNVIRRRPGHAEVVKL